MVAGIEDDLDKNTDATTSTNPDTVDQNTPDHYDSSKHTPPIETTVSPAPVKRGRGRPRKHPVQANFTSLSDVFSVANHSDSFTTSDVSLKQSQFTVSRQKEISGLLEKGVFKVVNPNDVLPNARVFNSRFVDEIKNVGTDKAFEKSRLIIQAYNDQEKGLVLTQSPTIQRVSQRLLICLAAMFLDKNTKIYLRDITQAYCQSRSNLNREFYIRPPQELATMLGISVENVLQVVKPLYGVPEAGNHWFATYHKHHTSNLGMTESTYDACLLFKSEPLGVIGLQTDDTLILADDAFATLEEEAIVAAKIMTKSRECLTTVSPIKFNGMKIELHVDGDITLRQKSYVDGISLVQSHDALSTSSKGVVRMKLSSKE